MASALSERERELSELGTAFRHVWRSFGALRGRDTHLAAGELSHAQFELLLELWEHGELPVGQLAEAARMAPGTVTQMLDLLALSGHVERVRSSSDRRVVVSRLSPQGLARIEAKRAAWSERWERALGDLDAGALRAASEVLERLAEMVESAPVECSPEDPAERRENPRAEGLAAPDPLL